MGNHLSNKIKNGLRNRKLFTLVKLLVVIAIIAILAALLLPSLRNARDARRRSTCVNNLRQLGMAFYAYMNDNDGYFPPYFMQVIPDSPSKLVWTKMLVKGGYISGKVFICPERVVNEYTPQWNEANEKTEPNQWFWYSPSYGYNFGYIGSTVYTGNTETTPESAKPPTAQISQIKNPSETILLVESASYPDRSKGAYGISPWKRGDGPIAWPVHGGGLICNVLWVDGHVTSLQATTTGEDGAKSLYDGPLSQYGNEPPLPQYWDRE